MIAAVFLAGDDEFMLPWNSIGLWAVLVGVLELFFQCVQG